MKIKNLTLANIRSFGEPTSIEFNDTFNILIGPNAGGKSNLLDIITIVIRHFFLINHRIELQQGENALTHRYIQRVETFGPIATHLEKFTTDSSNSHITIDFQIDAQDILNIKGIKANKGALDDARKTFYTGTSYDNINFLDQWDSSKLAEGQVLRYGIVNNNVQTMPQGSAEYIFLTYLNFYEYFSILANDIESLNLQPLFLYFPPNRNADIPNLQASLSSEDYYALRGDYFNSTSRSSSSLIRLATHYFALKRRKLEESASTIGYLEQWKNDEEVRLITKYLSRLGYAWSLKVSDSGKNIYRLLLTKDDREFDIRQASSGEKEIINFLMGVFAFNVKAGIVLVDEPELHLHPQWENVLIDLFVELAKNTHSMFILATHSPTFINEETISHVVRVSKNEKGSSDVVPLDKTRLNKTKDLLHIVRSHNNEKMFFADKIVLVEGITDRLIFEKIIGSLQKQMAPIEIVEVLEVGGKENLIKYREFLDGFKVWNAIIADLDYVSTVGDEEIMKLFAVDDRKVDREILGDKKSKDRLTVLAKLREAVTSGNVAALASVLEYVENRKRTIRTDLGDAERKMLDTFVRTQRAKRVFLLEKGEIEDYMPNGSKDAQGVIELMKDRNFDEWMNKEKNSDAVKELLDICTEILSDNQFGGQK